MNRRNRLPYLMLLLFWSCRVSYEQPLLTKIKIQNAPKQIDTDELISLSRQQPNKKILFVVPFHRKVYEFGNTLPDRSDVKTQKIQKRIDKRKAQGKRIDIRKMEEKKQRTLRNWLMNVVGEQPVLLDTMQTKISERQMELYLQNKGFFNAQVQAQYTFNKKRTKAKVHYVLEPGHQYTIAKYQIVTDDERLSSLLSQIQKQTLITPGMNYDADVLDSERDRIVAFLRNIGFYYFSKSFLYYQADSTLGNHTIDLKLFIRPFVIRENDELSVQVHPRYVLGNIWYYTNFSFQKTSIQYDTMKISTKTILQDTISANYYFIYTPPIPVRVKTLIQQSHLQPGQFVSIQKANQTISSLSSLGTFRYVNIHFSETPYTYRGFQVMDAHIQLIPSSKQFIQLEAETTHSSGSMGTAAALAYRNKNTFRGGELLSIKLRTALEFQMSLIQSDSLQQQELIKGLPFNTFETGIETWLTLPEFLLPYSSKLFNIRNKPKTSIQAGFFYQQRPDFDRQIIHVQYEYQWFETRQKFHQLTPFFMNVLRIRPDSSFLLIIQQYSRQIQNSYKDHFISGTRWNYTYSTQSEGNDKTFSLLRINAETAGNLARLYSIVVGGARPGETYYFFNIRFAQYTRVEVDFRRYWHNADKNSTNVVRLFTGVAVPYGNTDVIPFEKRFSAGGSNDIRAWKFRSLGPGSYRDDNVFDKTGDICLVINLENRFPLYKMLHSAVFIDIGNVWMIRDYPDFPGGQFRFDTFYNQLAVGAGFGLRFDLGFFVFRVDAAAPVTDPGRLWNGSHAPPATELPGLTNINFGIGYPF